MDKDYEDEVFEEVDPTIELPEEPEEPKIIQNEEQRKNPDKYKEEIIQRFKALTPLSILKSFKDEDDIWDFIKLDKEWCPKEGEIRKRVDISTTESDPEKVKAQVNDMITKAVNEIIGSIKEES